MGKKLLKLRKERGLTMREMAQRIGTDNSKLSKIEKGQINITYLKFLSLLKAIDVSPTEFFKEEEH
jgi:transcriptional regulator with XRE-family HTH domain